MESGVGLDDPCGSLPTQESLCPCVSGTHRFHPSWCFVVLGESIWFLSHEILPAEAWCPCRRTRWHVSHSGVSLGCNMELSSCFPSSLVVCSPCIHVIQCITIVLGCPCHQNPSFSCCLLKISVSVGRDFWRLTIKDTQMWKKGLVQGQRGWGKCFSPVYTRWSLQRCPSSGLGLKIFSIYLYFPASVAGGWSLLAHPGARVLLFHPGVFRTPQPFSV